MFTVLKKEINAFFNSPAAYLVMSIFITGIGLFMWVFPQTAVLDYGYAGLDTLFSITPFIYLFLIPAITMRTFAEEKQSGTAELLFTRPLSDVQIVTAKYAAGLLLVVFALLPTLIYYISVYDLGAERGNIDSAATAGSYIGLLLLGAVFTAIGVFSSSVTDNQIVAFILAVFLCFILFTGISSAASVELWADYAFIINNLSLDFHYFALSKGLINSVNVIYFLSLIYLFLHLTTLVIGRRKW